MTDLQHLRELAQKATPGPWTYSKGKSPGDECITQTSHITRDVWYIPHRDGDMEFIAACSPDRILALIDIADAAERILEHGPNGCDAIECFRDALARLRGAK